MDKTVATKLRTALAFCGKMDYGPGTHVLSESGLFLNLRLVLDTNQGQGGRQVTERHLSSRRPSVTPRQNCDESIGGTRQDLPYHRNSYRRRRSDAGRRDWRRGPRRTQSAAPTHRRTQKQSVLKIHTNRYFTIAACQ